MNEILAWLLLAVCILETVSSWLFRRRLKMQHKMLVTLCSECAKSRERDAEEWRAKIRDGSLSNEERRLARDHMVGAAANALAYRDVASDIEHILVNGKSLASRTKVVANEIEKLQQVQAATPAKQATVVFVSKGGDA